MKYIITGLLSAALLLLLPSKTPVNNSTSVQNVQPVQAAAPEKAATVQSNALKEQEAIIEPETQPTTVQPAKQPEPVAVAQPPVNDAEAEAKAFIYHKESTNNPAAENYLGCYGLGQDCNGIVKKKCGADYSCQDAFFTDYMKRRYGTWQKAKSFWLARVAINGKDVGHWW